MAYTKLSVKCSVLKNGVHYLTSDYKTRNKKRPTHSGMDMIGKGYACDYILAIEKGTVITAKYSITAGYYVEIKHDNGIISRYLHLKKKSMKVKKGDKVSKGQIIGYMGNTGASRGAHLHFGVKSNGKHVDPKPYLIGEKKFNATSTKKAYTGTFPKLPNRGYFKKSDKGTEVKNLQKFLNWAVGSKLTVDGVLGDKSISAIKQFQKVVSLKQDGLFGKNCLSKAKSYKK